MTDLLETVLTDLVPTFADEHPDWKDVLARSATPKQTKYRWFQAELLRTSSWMRASMARSSMSVVRSGVGKRRQSHWR